MSDWDELIGFLVAARDEMYVPVTAQEQEETRLKFNKARVTLYDAISAVEQERDAIDTLYQEKIAELQKANEECLAFYKWAREDTGDHGDSWDNLSKLCDTHDARVGAK